MRPALGRITGGLMNCNSRGLHNVPREGRKREKASNCITLNHLGSITVGAFNTSKAYPDEPRRLCPNVAKQFSQSLPSLLRFRPFSAL